MSEMQNFFIPSRSRRRMPKRSSLRPRQRGIFLSSAAQIQRTRRQRRDGESKTGFFGLRILRSACRANRKRDKLTIRPPRNPRGRRHGSWLLFVEIIEKRQNHDDVYIAIDISKNAVKICAKRNPEAECAVASVYDMPLADEFADVVICVFSPFAMDEYARILKNGGILILAYPCENHLIELRRALYENVRSVATSLPSSTLTLLSQNEITYSFNLDSSKTISDLLTMTPYVYRAPKSSVEEVKSKTSLALTADFCLCTLEKTIR